MVYLKNGVTDAYGKNLQKGWSLCGASLITDQWVITAAHCVDKVLVRNNIDSMGQSSCYFKLYLGEVNHATTKETDWVEITATAEKVIIHGDWDARNINNDIALIKLPEKIELDQKIFGTPCFLHDVDTADFVGSECYVAGWGTQENGKTSDIIKHVKVDLLTDAQCESFLQEWNPYEKMKPGTICAGAHEGAKGLGSCKGDSGGALFCNKGGRYYQIGLVSYGMMKECGSARLQGKNRYGVFTKISYFKDWINTVIGSY
jgi:secreted trypsin-like serine protease